MRCDYCYKGHEEHYSESIDFSTIDNALKMLFEGTDTENLEISFHGGEPMLAFDKVEYVINRIHTFVSSEVKVSYQVVTNGTHINKSILECLREHNFSVAISLDGPELIHDKSRRYKNGNSTHADIMSNVENYFASLAETNRVIYAITLSPSIKYDMNSMYEYFSNQYRIYNIDFNMFSMHSFARNKFRLNSIDEYINYYRESIAAYTECILKHCLQDGSLKPIVHHNRFPPTYLRMLIDKRSSRMKCGAGIENAAIFPDGQITGCRLIVPKEYPNSVWGNAKLNEIYNNRSQVFRDYVSASKYCIECSISSLCTGCCPALNYYQTGNTDSAAWERCIEQKELFKSSVWLYHRLKAEGILE